MITTIEVDINELSDFENLDKYITEILDQVIDKDLRSKLSSRRIRRELLQKYGSRAFLYPKKLKFPIINPDTGECDQKLLYAARVRLRQYCRNNPLYQFLIRIADNMYKDTFDIKIKVKGLKQPAQVSLLQLVEMLCS